MADTMSQKVVAWAHSKLRQRVGRGECWDLADQALRASGARTSKTTGPDDNLRLGNTCAGRAGGPWRHSSVSQLEREDYNRDDRPLY